MDDLDRLAAANRMVRQEPKPRENEGVGMGIAVVFGVLVAVIVVVLVTGARKGLLDVPSAPASERATVTRDEAGRISLANFHRVEIGMDAGEVQRILGLASAEVSTHAILNTRYATYQWDQGEFAFCQVNFKNGRVFGKTQVGLR